MSTLPVIFAPLAQEIRLPQRPVRAIGIDLGTTNSTVAELVWRPEEGIPAPARCLEIPQPTQEGTYTHVLVPSVVALYQGKVIVGEGAKRLRAFPELGLSQNKTLFSECKNDIGVARTYHKAPPGFQSAAEVSGVILKFLAQAAQEDDPLPLDRTVVTVPASFQAAQRQDTLRAAELAGIQVQGGNLLDEPVAAFLDYLFLQGKDILPELQTPRKVVVFDFGGGTCDVAVFRLGVAPRQQALQIEPLAVSRYHRLGGGDIDAAIVHEVLVPQLCDQNGLSAFDLGFDDKKNYVGPAYLGLAETLKISLCTQISRLLRFNKYEGTDKTQIMAKRPGVHPCNLPSRALALQSPTLSASDFEKLLAPFLDQDLLYARETEYRLTCSIFAPLQDALERSGVEAGEIDFCLAVGGSSLIPQVTAALQKFLPRGRLLTYDDQDSLQTAIARGAAYHALSLALFGKGLVQPVSHDHLAIRSASGAVGMIPKGMPLPYPPDGGHAQSFDLAVPETVLSGTIPLRVEIVGGQEERLLYSETWDIPGPVQRGDPLLLEYRYDENQILSLNMRLAAERDIPPFSAQVDKPFTNVVNPWSEKIVIETMEEELRTGKVPKAQIPARMVELAKRYADLGQREKAIEYLQRVLRTKNRPDADILNKIGIYYGELGDFQRQEKYYREAARASTWGGPWFNLSLAQDKQGHYADAMESIDKALRQQREAPYLVQKAMLAEKLKNPEARNSCLQEALGLFGPVSSLSDWELGWYLTAAQMRDDQERISAAQAERQKRAKQEGDTASGQLPIMTQAVARVDQ
ncbi:MAG: Hsp70 family protein [Desulfobacteraceae bacterium]